MSTQPNSEPIYDVVGIGNALVDVIAHADDNFIHEQALVKGSMTLVDTDRALHLYKALGTAVEMSGGSAANTVCGVASFGGKAAYIGKVSHDDLGEVFGHDLLAVGVHFSPGHHLDGIPTGRCIIVVTPDAQRTMNTFLGVSSFMEPKDVDVSVVASGKVLYMEGYLFDRDDAKAAFRRAARAAHEAGREVSLSLSDSFCVDRHREDFRALVADEVDILFGNEDELLSLYQLDTFEAAVAATLARYGRIDVLVNNVGGSAAGGPIEMSEEVWDAQIDHNLKSVFLMCKHVLPHMLQQGAGNVVNMASTSGIRWTGSAQVAYAATKAAVIQMGRVMAVQFAKQDIRVNTVVPGQLHTPMVETRLAKQRAGGDVQTLLAQRQARIPLPFMGNGQDTANAVLFLASDEARFITGTEIIVDGGMSVRCD